MLAAGGVLVLGAGLTALGVVAPTMYPIGIAVIVIALVGILVRLIDWIRWLRS